ncbi:unnamed protein product [Prorocentrum cordatum]|uniref:Uncharacterized protein n=1 Tax=Prorocentrum cordatum TaxID=2364126 RepID=A0ABN9SHR8_9DINO|nr:unnamed protein product [Polarella glacialis]
MLCHLALIACSAMPSRTRVADALRKPTNAPLREEWIRAELEATAADYIARDDGRRWQPTRRDFERDIDMSKNSAPGPDGIPIGAWRALGYPAANLLHQAYREIVESEDVEAIGDSYPEFNETVMVFLPKTLVGKDGDEAERTRPLNITNTDNRLMANTVRLRIGPASIR